VSRATWRVEVSSEAKRGLDRLPEKVAAAIVEFITGPLPDNPLRVSKDLSGRLAGYRSARRGDYRVVIQTIDVDQVVLVVRIDHRAHVYRPR
jgi:mRNA interferase RelE/StbE